MEEVERMANTRREGDEPTDFIPLSMDDAATAILDLIGINLNILLS
jgi:hypothetical protein